MLNIDSCRISDFIMGEPEYEKMYFEDMLIVTGHTPTGFIDPEYTGQIRDVYKRQDLKQLVNELENNTNNEEQIKILQKIGKVLITEYEIKVGNITIAPLLIEAYYYNCNNFPDCNTHMKPNQKKFNELYRHSIKNGLKCNGRKGGVDICLASVSYTHLGKRHVYRLGGDEFIAVLPNVTHPAFQKLLETAKSQLGATVSLGTAISGTKDTDFESL